MALHHVVEQPLNILVCTLHRSVGAARSDQRMNHVGVWKACSQVIGCEPIPKDALVLGRERWRGLVAYWLEFQPLQECCHLTLAHRYILELSSIICLEDIWRTKIAKDLVELLKNSVLILALQLSKPHERREMVLDGENVLVACIRGWVARGQDDEVNLHTFARIFGSYWRVTRLHLRVAL